VKNPGTDIQPIAGWSKPGGGDVSQFERQFRLKHIFDSGRCFDKAYLMAELGGVSFATLKRDIELLRDRMNCPVVFDKQNGGYRLDPASQAIGTQYELPGLWFTAEEIHALLTMQHLLANLDAGGLLGPYIAPLIKRLTKLIDVGNHTGEELARRIKVQTVGARPVHLPHFQAVGSALLRRQRLAISYHARTTDEASEREVSPQRLIHYRDNWYLDAWCHLRQGLRSFSVDAIKQVRVEDKTAIDVPEPELDAVLGSGYGIFSGKQVQWAELRFTPERARWVAAESWHPRQVGRFEADGTYLLRLPYADPRELVMDVMRHVPDVDVVGPPELRKEVAKRLIAGCEKISGELSP
jgi:predicted DNA-binding transcriptional regulator YafY